MTSAGDVDDPCGLGSLHLVQEKVGEEEVAEVVDLEHRLLTVVSQGSLGREHPGVVDQDVDLLLLLAHLTAELTDAGEGSQVTFLDFDIGQSNVFHCSLRSLNAPFYNEMSTSPTFVLRTEIQPACHDDGGSPLRQTSDRLLANAGVGARDDGHTPREVNIGQRPVGLTTLGPVSQRLQESVDIIRAFPIADSLSHGVQLSVVMLNNYY